MIINKIHAYLYKCMKNGISVSMDEMCSRKKERKLRYKFISGVSVYSDTMQDGAETIAEAFVKRKNVEVITKELKQLLEEYIGVI